MAKIRAYKIAEELGIDRNDLIDKAKAVGVELKSPMVQLEEDEASQLRQKLSGHIPGAQVTERRVESQGGASVIRRRKRAPEPAAPAAPPRPEPVVESVAVAVPESVGDLQPSESAELELAEEVAPEPAPAFESEPAAPSALDARDSSAAEAPARTAAAAEAREAPDRLGDFGGGAAPPGKGKQRKRVREVVNLREQEQITRVVTGRVARRPISIDPRALQSPRRRRRDKAPAIRPAVATAAPRTAKRVVRTEGQISVADLARQLGAKAADVQARLMALGTMASVNQLLDLDTAGQVAAAYGFEVQDVGFQEAEVLGEAAAPADAGKLEPRPPIVTVMGHVDHGKTSLLDAIRKADVAGGEAGGITQHIGAYSVQTAHGPITFLDTPGHEAFTAMRQRGAQVTDLVVLVVAADDGVMPQTVEAIKHAKAAGVTILVAINKIDKPGASPERVMQQLTEYELVPEQWGGTTIMMPVSARTKDVLPELLEYIALQAEVLDLKANPEKSATGVIVEAKLEKGRGPVATVLVQDGTLRVGDAMVTGSHHGKVRAMMNERGEQVKEVLAGYPVEVLGLSGVPTAGDEFNVVSDEKAAKEVAEHRAEKARQKELSSVKKATLEDLFAKAKSGGAKELNVVVKADVQGSAEAVSQALEKLGTRKVKVSVLDSGVGAVTESDVLTAAAGKAIIVGFHTKPETKVDQIASQQGVKILLFDIIYEAADSVRNEMVNLLDPIIKEKALGKAEVRAVFNIPRSGVIAGCAVTEGVVKRTGHVRVLRERKVVFAGKIGSLKRVKDDVKEVQAGFECGIGVEGYQDVKVGDVLEVFELEEIRPSLD